MSANQLVVTGDTIPIEPNTLIGYGITLPTAVHNTTDNNTTELHTVIATLSGTIQRVNKLITVKTMNHRYTGEIGDIVIGRIVSIIDNKWKVDIQSHTHATLALSSVYLPTAVQRRKTVDDELYMTQLFNVNDLICAEIQKLQQSAILHTRNIQYGKLINGQLCMVNHNLIKRCKQHYQTLDNINIHIILGNNGAIWIYDPTVQPNNTQLQNDSAELSEQYTIYTDEYIQQLTTAKQSRQSIARVYNCILLLAQYNKLIWNYSIMQVYQATVQLKLIVKQIGDKQYAEQIFQTVEQQHPNNNTNKRMKV